MILCSTTAKPRLSLLTLALACMHAPNLWAEEAASLEEAVLKGKATLDLRYRYEFVDQEGLADANASTLRTRLTLESQSYMGLAGTLEFDNNSVVLEDDYNDGPGGDVDLSKDRYAVIADPTYTEVNQAFLSYTTPFATSLRAGRQRIVFDNQRFIGGVAWRQNEQTFDAVSLQNKSLPDTTLNYAYVYNVNRINLSDLDGEHHFLNIGNTALAAANLSAYAYLLDEIHDTFGLRLTGKLAVNESTAALYTLEYAKQEDDGVGVEYKADYYLLEAGAAVSGVTAKLGYEVQGSDDGKRAFSTPLGTNHAFNGWADRFLATPNNGLEDLYLSLSTQALGPEVTLMYHQFEANEGSTEFGDEIDLAISQSFATRYNVLLKYAHFNSDSTLPDTDKVWLQLSAKF